MTLEYWKAQAYDTMRQIKTLQAKLAETENLIANYKTTPKPTEVDK